MKPFFDFVFEHIPNFDPTKAMIIGDSYSADIMGGAGAGIDTCWLNPHKNPTKVVQPTYMIEKITQLVTILGNSKIILKK